MAFLYRLVENSILSTGSHLHVTKVTVFSVTLTKILKAVNS